MLLSTNRSQKKEREHRNKFHTFLSEYSYSRVVDRWSGSISGILLVTWVFFAIGPGSIFGNFVFGKPNSGYDAWVFGMPSIWAWQIIWWALGVGMVWFIANKAKMSTELEMEIKDIN